MAAKIAAEGESPETSYFLWEQVYGTTADPSVKKNAEDHLKLMQVQLDLRTIDRLAGELEKKPGNRPTRIAEFVQAGLLQAAPRETRRDIHMFSEKAERPS